MTMLSQEFTEFVDTVRPAMDETEYYARIIMEHEGRPASSLPDCRREAELQLWADRSIRPRSARKGRWRSAAG